MNPIYRILAASFFWGMGGSLNWLFLNFHLEALGLSKSLIGYANATPAVAGVLFSLPLAFLIPRLGYARSILLGGLLAILGVLGVASGVAVFPGLFLSGAGQLFVTGAVAPLLARLVHPDQQVRVFAWQGALGTGSGFLGSLIGGVLPHLIGREFVMYGVALSFVLSVLCVRGLKDAPGSARRFALRNPRAWLLLLLPQGIVSLGAGLTMPFLNLFLRGKFALDYTAVGGLFALSSLATMATMLVQPYLVRRMGKVGAIIFVQAASLPFLVILAWVPWLPLVTVALFVRGALMNAAGPVYTALVMDHLDEEERSGFLLVEGSVWQLGWAGAAAVSGRVQQAMGIGGFDYLFGAMLGLYMASILCYPLFFRPRRRAAEGV
ncbi:MULTISPECIES: MFS transporter [unclassified Meiothermus]|uniref:MFS transporter n=1 Tax=unclassified Meiothermus TaxID=370471 RepID=UPI000D7C9625|nr:MULTISPECIES: MFS transporter [unclassified Meiothermus]PZA08178.1 MFS transporter [Meiothermus sp. Pnk-1]RYM32669.1 MFS transporter [Meiothermus sp. PNK-Is4]